MKVLITGGSGLIGNKITQLLLKKNIKVVHLTRNRNSKSGVKTYEWDWEKGTIDVKCFEGVTHIIHLAGAGIADKAWTMKRKRFIINSRVETAKLIHKTIQNNNIQIQAFISASGTGYYGAITNETIFNEEDSSHNDFMGKCCQYWENAADLFKPNCRVVKLRTGLVLDKQEGALSKMTSIIKMGIGAPLGSGKQYVPWIHIDDIANLYIYVLENESISGSFNAVASEHITNKQLTYALAQSLNKKIRFKKVPSFFIKTVYGELSDLVIHGSKVSNKKILETGFKMEFPELNTALKDIYKS